MPAPAIGQVLLGQFRVEAFLAAGGMGSVYRVYDLKRRVTLAMKVIHVDLMEEERLIKHFKREAQVLRRLAHPNIVPFYGFYQTEELFFLLEGYVDGPTLKEVLRRRKRLSLEEALIVLKGVGAALNYAHQHGVVHCDVKPSNVMIDRGGRVYLADFGIARHSETLTTTLMFAGTPAYMAPEQVLGKPVSPATDVYSLGVMAYQLLTGHHPFAHLAQTPEGSPPRERLRQAHLKARPRDPRQFAPHLPPEVSAVLFRALSKAPQQRYQDVWAFFRALTAALGRPPESIPDRLPPEGLADSLTSLPTQAPTTAPAGAPAYSPTPAFPVAAPSAPAGRGPWPWLLIGVSLFLGVLLLGGGALFLLTRTPHAGAPKPSAPPPALAPPAGGATATPIPAATTTPTTASAPVAAPTTPPSPTPFPTATPTTPPPASPGHFAYEHFTTSWNADLYLLAAQGGSPRPLVASDATERYPALSPDGRFLAYAASANGEPYNLYVLDRQTGRPTQVTDWDRTEWYPAWAPDGSALVFSSNERRGGRDYDLYILTWPEGEVYTLTAGDGVDNLPSWSPDGQWIAFQRALHGSWRIYLIHPDGSGLYPLTEGKAPAWSPDGRFLAYAHTEHRNADIYLYDLQTGEVQRLTDYAGDDRDPCWSPDGRYIFFESQRGGTWDIYRLTLSDGTVTRMTTSPQDDMSPACGP